LTRDIRTQLDTVRLILDHYVDLRDSHGMLSLNMAEAAQVILDASLQTR
jgi:hypothetical protein